MAKLPINVVNFAGVDNTMVFELFQDYFAHYMKEQQGKNIGSYDTTITFAEKEQKMNKALLSEISRLSQCEITAENVRAMSKNPMVNWASMAVVEAMIDAVLPSVLIDIAPFAEIRNIGWGDSASFEIKPRTLMTVSEAGTDLRTTFIQKEFATTKTMVGRNHMITVQASLYRVLCGIESLAEFVRKAILSIEVEMTRDAYGAFDAALSAVTMPAALKVTGYDQEDLLKIAQRVSAYNGGAKAVIMGTSVAVSKILPNGADGWRITTPGDNMKISLIKNFFDYDIIVLPQVATGDYENFGMALDDDKLYIVSPTSDKLIKGVVEGTDLANSNDFYDNANLTSDYTIRKRWDFEFMSNAIAGCVELN